MEGVSGNFMGGVISGEANPALSSDLNEFTEAGYDPQVFDAPIDWAMDADIQHHRVATDNSWGVVGSVLSGYFEDFYYRIYVLPSELDVGNLVTAQVREISVWNAWPYTSQTLIGADVANAEGIDVELPGDLPLEFRPTSERIIHLSLSADGPSIIDSSLALEWAGLETITITITGRRLQAWPITADWGSPVRETMAWLTEIQESADGSEDREPKRGAPRRSWGFDVVEGRFERRFIENAVFDWAGRIWALPVLTDLELLAAALPAGSSTIPADTAGLDFVDGGVALLWSAVNRFELVEIEAVAADALALARPTLQDWPAGTRLYPCRSARLAQAPQWRRKNDRVITAQVEFDAAEPCDFPAVAPAATYKDIPVLEWRLDEGDDPTASTPRALNVIDNDVGLLDVTDLSGLARGLQSHAFVLHGRAERAQHRSLMYWLEGRAQSLWVPTWADDIGLRDTLAAGATTMFVDAAGITTALRGQPGRRHIRIELYSGAVYYREVLASAALDAERETLLVDAPFDVDLAPGQIRVISWMALQRQASDRVEIAHVNDSHGLARSGTSFTMVGAEEP